MMRTFVLREDRNAQALYAFLKANWRACADQGKPLAVQVMPEKSKRSQEQNRRYWAVLQEVEAQAWINGRQFAAEVWHENFKRTLLGCVDLPNGQVMGISTTTLSVGEFADYMTRVEHWATENLGVQFSDPAPEPLGRAS